MAGPIILGFVLLGIFCGAFGGRTGMLMLWKLGVPIVAIPSYDATPLSRREEASMTGVIFGVLAGGIMTGIFAAFGMAMGLLGLCLSVPLVPVVYLVLFGFFGLLGLVLATIIRGMRRVSDALVSLVPGQPPREE